MRNVARLKMGYYPLPETEGAKLRSLLSYSQTASVIDPCVGQGSALQIITHDAPARLYGVELDAERSRIYNHDDALQYEERMKEYAEEEENREQYEFPEVEKALPECVRKSLTHDDHAAFARKARRQLAEHRSGRYRSSIERLRKIDALSRLRMTTDPCFREDGGYDSPRLHHFQCFWPKK